MKKILTGLLFVSCLAGTAAAQNKQSGNKKYCPAKTCTDHSYDAALGERTENVTTRTKMSHNKKSCPAANCTDHSYDAAYSGSGVRSTTMQQRRADRVMPAARQDIYVDMAQNMSQTAPRNGSNTGGYSMNDFIFYGRTYNGIIRPSAYAGDDAPTYDGAALNAYRNMRVNNTSERLPANNGQR